MPADCRFCLLAKRARYCLDFDSQIPLSAAWAVPLGKTVLMQSTGQTGIHKSHPEHSAVTTVCIVLALPTIASTGQALMHSVHPMHSVSSISTGLAGR